MRKPFILLIPSLALTGCSYFTFSPKTTSDVDTLFKFDYGVFLGIEREDLSKIKEYETVVIDAQYFNKSDIDELHKNKQVVYSYLNVGSIENFRDYYSDYVDITLGEYENWEEERWVDVSQSKWQDFILNNLSVSILNKGVDGLFIDNIDVYYEYKQENIYSGVETILKGLKNKNTYISINGGDTFVYEYLERNHNISDVMDAVNQETVYTKINWETETFSQNDEEERKYFQE